MSFGRGTIAPGALLLAGWLACGGGSEGKPATTVVAAAGDSMSLTLLEPGDPIWWEPGDLDPGEDVDSALAELRNPVVEVLCEPPGHWLHIDTTWQRRTPAGLVVEPGEHRISVLDRHTDDTLCTTVETLPLHDRLCLSCDVERRQFNPCG